MRSTPPVRKRHAFGFDHVMANPDYSQFPAYYERAMLLPIIGRSEVDAIFSSPALRQAA